MVEHHHELSKTLGVVDLLGHVSYSRGRAVFFWVHVRLVDHKESKYLGSTLSADCVYGA